MSSSFGTLWTLAQQVPLSMELVPRTRQWTWGLVSLYILSTLPRTWHRGVIPQMLVEITFGFLTQLGLLLVDPVVNLFNCHQAPDQGTFQCFLLLPSSFLFAFSSPALMALFSCYPKPSQVVLGPLYPSVKKACSAFRCFQLLSWIHAKMWMTDENDS